MASVRKEDIPEIAQFMPEFWEIIKKYWIVEDMDEWWEEVIGVCDACYKKYNDPFVRKMVVAFIEYLEEKRNEERRKAGCHESVRCAGTIQHKC